MQNTHNINDSKTSCKYCGKMLLKKNMGRHINTCHKDEENFELKSKMIDVIYAIDIMRLDFLTIKEASNSVYKNYNENLFQDNLFIRFEESMKVFQKLNLAQEIKLHEFLKSCK